jgi:hypothetical protein
MPRHGTNGSSHPRARLTEHALTPVLAVHTAQAAHASGDLLDGHRPGAVAGISSPRGEIFHDHDEVVLGLVDQRGVDEGVFERQIHPADEQSWLMKHAAG